MSLLRVATLLLLVSAAILSGCGQREDLSTEPVEPFPGQTVRVAAIGDPAILETAALQIGEWEQTRGGRIEIRKTPIEPGEPIQGVDVLLFPGDQVGHLIDVGAIEVIPDSVIQPAAPGRTDWDDRDGSPEPLADPLAFEQIVPVYRDQVIRYGDRRIGLPYGGSALVLVYRKQALEAGAGESPRELPRTWEQLDALARSLQGIDWNGNGDSGAGIALALGADPEGVGTMILLARASALGMHPDYYSLHFDSDTMEPRIASAPFVEALRDLVALKEAGPSGMESFDIEAAREAFRSGKVALLIDRAERVHRWVDREATSKVGVAPLPGSDRVYHPFRKVWEEVETPNRASYLPVGGGWIVGVPTQAAQRAAAQDFARFLIEPETALRIRSDRAFPMVPVRGALIGQGPPDPRSIAAVDLLSWSEAVSRTFMAPQVVLGLRIPEAEGYLADLDRARVAAASGAEAEAALEGAAEAWRNRTERLGKARQLWHYRRSLNALATSPEPPPRTPSEGSR
ncbi:extracellular solute-binding protein [soil metagenome]